MVLLERCSQNSQENTCVRDSILIEGCKKETPAQVVSYEFFDISKNTFFTEHLRTTACAFKAFPYNFTKMRHCQQYFENLR